MVIRAKNHTEHSNMGESNGNWSLAACGLMAALLCLPLLSCGDEDAPGHDSSEDVRGDICFSVSTGDAAWTRSRAGEVSDEHPSDSFVLRAEGSDDIFCVCTVVSDGICPSSGCDGKVVTRGAPVAESNFYTDFHVLAYRKTGGVLADQFFMDEDVTNGGSGTWSTAKAYYWPGAEHLLKFYAWAPAGINFSSVPSTSASTTLGFTVPADAARQKDLVVAVTGDIRGDNNSAVPLTFKHVCTAVSFQVGNQMQSGIIKSVALAGVKYKGTYDMESGVWTLDESTKNFSQELNLSTTGTETNGAPVTAVEGTFMMLPQVLPAGAKMIVEFESRVTGETYQLEASIAGGEWKMGVPTVYKLSITPELDIEVPEAQDAHYITFPVTVHVKRYTGDWELTSNLPSDVFFTATKTPLQEQGYWIDEDKGTSTVTGTGEGNFTYHVYVTENVTDAARDIEFQLKSMVSGVATSPVTATVQQLCPSWNSSGVGYERIEESSGGNYPFGFSWDMVATFSYSKITTGGYNHLFNKATALRNSSNEGYYSVTKPSSSTITATIDYKNAFNLGKSATDGLANTRELFLNPNKEGFQDAITLDDNVDRIIYIISTFTRTTSGGDFQTASNYAVRMAVMKNKFNRAADGTPEIAEGDIKWYLPAKDEQSSLTDEAYPLSGTYWSSTTTNNNSAYSYNGSSVSATNRMTNCKIRAARKRP